MTQQPAAIREPRFPFTAIVGQTPNEAGAAAQCHQPSHRRCAGAGEKGHGQEHRRALAGCAAAPGSGGAGVFLQLPTRRAPGRVPLVPAGGTSRQSVRSPGPHRRLARGSHRRPPGGVPWTSSRPSSPAKRTSSPASSPLLTAASCTSTRSTCSTTTWWTCCWTPPHGPQLRGTRGHLRQPRRRVHAGRHHEPRGRRSPPAIARPLRLGRGG